MRLRLLLWACFACAGCATDTIGRHTEPIIHGEDDRLDVYLHRDAALRERARASIVALMNSGMLRERVPGEFVLEEPPTVGEMTGLCADEPFVDQPAASFCSGTLIEEDLVLTAGHCLTDETPCAALRLVFDYLYTSAGVLERLDADDVYACAEVVERRFDSGTDYMIVRLDRPVVGHRPAEVARTWVAELDAPLTMIGFPEGAPAKIDDGGRVVSPRADRDGAFTASTDSFVGSSGSGVFAADGALIGLLTEGAADYWQGSDCVRRVRTSNEEARETVTFAENAFEALCESDRAPEALCAQPVSGARGCSAGPMGRSSVFTTLCFGALFGLWRRRTRVG